jgi:hypothetical protein
MPRRIALVLLAVLASSIAIPAEGADPRGSLHLIWSAPGSVEQPADAYELRTSPIAPGSDLLAWWGTATPVSNVPAPAAPGAKQSLHLDDLPVGATVYAAIRTRFADVWTAPSPVLTWTSPAGPWIQSVTPTRVDAAGSKSFTVKGHGLAGTRQASFISASGVRMSAGIRAYSDSLAVVTADISSFGIGTVDLELAGAVGTDVLRRWIYVSVPAIADTQAPSIVTDLAVSVVDHQSVLLTWTAPADPTPYGTARASRYDVRRRSGDAASWTWEGATPITSPIPGAPGGQDALLVSGLAPGSTATFALAAGDAAGNWALPSNRVTATTATAPDVNAPATVTDLSVELQPDGGALLRWTAPAHDQGLPASYRVWRWNAKTTAYPMDEALLLQSAPAPLPAGSPQTWSAGVVAAGTWAAFRLSAVDSAGNVAPLSNAVIVDRTGDDVTPPALPGEFTASQYSQGTVQLRWIGSGDDGKKGRVRRYEMRHMESPPADTPWWEGVPSTIVDGHPKPAGKQEFTNIANVTLGKKHGYAVRGVDEAENASPWAVAVVVMDAARFHTEAAPPPAPDSLSATRESAGVRLTWLPVPSAEVVSYNVYCSQAGELAVCIASVNAVSTSYTDITAPSTVARYAVSALDGEGNESRLAAWADVDCFANAPSVRVTPDGTAWRVSISESASGQTMTRGAPPDVAVFDVLGRLVARVSARPSGDGWEARWSGEASGGVRTAQGIYFVRAAGDTWSRTQRVLIHR